MGKPVKVGKVWRHRVREKGIDKSGTFRTLSDANAWAAALLAEAADVKRGGLPHKTLRQAFERFRDEVAPNRKGGRWEAVRIGLFIRTMPFVDERISEVTTAMIADWRDSRLKDVSSPSVRREMNLLGSIFTLARREWQWIKESPMVDVRKPPSAPHRKRRLIGDELERLKLSFGISENMGTPNRTQEVGLAFLFAIETTMRQGEILDMLWSNIDLKRKVVFVPTSKNGNSKEIPLSPAALSILSKLKSDRERVFSIDSRQRDALWRKCRDRAMVSGLRFHDLRREATSRLAKLVDVLTLARITGHKDLKMLMVYYQTDMGDVAKLLEE